jgi:hypothetical protein
MPRPSPSKDYYISKYLDGLQDKIVSIHDSKGFNVNTKIVLLCDNGHEYITSITKIKNLDQNPHDCPHCKKEEKYTKMGIPFSILNDYSIKNNMEIQNIQDYYNRWTDHLQLKCTKCGKEHIIKSLNYLHKNIDTPFECSGCIMVQKGIIDEESFDTTIQNIKLKPLLYEQTYLKTIYNSIPSGLKDKIQSQNKWELIDYTNTKAKCKYKCNDCGFIKNTLPYNIFNGKGFGCPNCLKIKQGQSMIDKLKSMFKDSHTYPMVEHIDNETPFDMKCNSCGHEFITSWKYIITHDYKINCPNCFKSTKRAAQNELYLWIKEHLGVEDLEQNNRENGFELDILSKSHNIAIEYCGLIWHSSKFNSNHKRHYEKLQKAKEHGIRLITIFEDEWTEKREICKSRLRNIFGSITQKIYAKECYSKIIDNKTALDFCNHYHIQGKGSATVSFGLFHNQTLVYVITFSKPSLAKSGKDFDYELNRMCSRADINVVGGASKLFKFIKDQLKGSKIITYSDLRWGTGGIYSQLGFTEVSLTKPNYYYFGKLTGWKRVHRYTFTKHRLLKYFDNSQDYSKYTESQLAEMLGLYKIHDCGHAKFEIGT